MIIICKINECINNSHTLLCKFLYFYIIRLSFTYTIVYSCFMYTIACIEINELDSFTQNPYFTYIYF